MFTHTSIRTSNIEKSIEFYNRFFDLKVVSRIPVKATDSEIVFLQDPSSQSAKLELTFYRSQKKFVQAEYEERLFDHLGFQVTDINETINRMREAGVTITDEPHKFNETGPIIAFVEDPDGTLIELVQE
jgi:lactoylglutathione lyase